MRLSRGARCQSIGTVILPRRWCVCLRGRLVEEFYDELERICTEAIELSPGGPVVALNIPIGQWHTARALESGTVILECKDGAYEPQSPEDIMTL